MTILSIHAKARSGKDTVAEHLAARYGFVQIALADPLDAAIYAIFEVPDLYRIEKDTVIPQYGVSLRQLKQRFGDTAKSIHDTILIENAEGLLSTSLGATDRVVISDIRRPVEADWARKQGLLIHLYRPDAPSVAPHHTENGIEPLEGEPVFHNLGNWDELFHQIDTWLDHVGILNPATQEA